MPRSSTTISLDFKCQAAAGAGLPHRVRTGVERRAAREDLAIGSYRYSVSRLIPQMTQVALQTHKKELMRETPNFAKQKFLYRLSRSDMKRSGEKTT